MHFSCSVVVLVLVLHSADLSHFRGGTVTWKAVNVSAVNTSTVDVIVEQIYSWRRSFYWCDSTTILTQGSIGGSNYLQCSTTPSCGGYTNNLSTEVQCTDYSVSTDMSSGRNSSILTLNSGSQLALNFYGGAWLALQTSGSSWSITTVINLQPRMDNGHLNTPPVSNILPVISVPLNIQRTIVVPMADDDNDYLRCRWSQKSSIFQSSQINITVDECGDVCEAVPNATLYGDNNGTSCRLVFTGTSLGYYAATLQIEDFYTNQNVTRPLSSVPVQFLINVYNGNCWPTIIGVQPNGASINVAQNANMSSVTVLAEIGCINTTIIDFLKISPAGMTTSTIVQDPTNSSLYSVELNWIPRSLGSQVFCCAAIDTNLAQSEMYCLTFVVIHSLPITVISATTTVKTTITAVAQLKGLNIGFIVGMAILGLLVCCALCSCCFYCCWLCVEWLCPALRWVCCRCICPNRCKRERQQQQRSLPNHLYYIPMTPSSSNIAASSSAHKPNGIISVARTVRLSNDFAELGLGYGGSMFTTLRQSVAHIRNSVELIRNARQKHAQSVKETTTKQCAPLSSCNNVVVVHRFKSVMKNKQQIYSDDKRKIIPADDYNARSTDASFEDEKNDEDHDDNVSVLPNEEQQNDRFKPFKKQQIRSVIVAKVSRRKKSAVPSVFC